MIICIYIPEQLPYKLSIKQQIRSLFWQKS